MRCALITADFMFRLRQHHHPTRRKHDIVVQILAHRFIKAARLFINRGRWILKIVGTNDCRVTACVAAAQPTFFQDRDIFDAVVFAQIIGRGQTMTARAHDDRVIAFFRCRGFPCAFPACVITGPFARDCKCRITSHVISNPVFRLCVRYAPILFISYDPVRHNTADLRHLGLLVVFLFITNSMIVTYVAIAMEGT